MKYWAMGLAVSVAAAACAAQQPPAAESREQMISSAGMANDPLVDTTSGGSHADLSTPAGNPAKAMPAAVNTHQTPTMASDSSAAAGMGGMVGMGGAGGNHPAPVAGQPDNSRVNSRDKGDSTLTAMDQGSSEGDRKITQQVRQLVMKDGSLSFTAKNVKIITVNGKVTLRGPVNTDQERAAIEAAAKKIAGEGKVDNQLEVKK